MNIQDTTNLCAWLREHSSGESRQLAEAAAVIEHLMRENARLAESEKRLEDLQASLQEHAEGQPVWIVNDEDGEHVMMCPKEPTREELLALNHKINRAVYVQAFVLFPADAVLGKAPTVVPSGFTLMPLVADDAMLEAIEDAMKAESKVEWDSNLGGQVHFGNPEAVYLAALAAAPKQAVAVSDAAQEPVAPVPTVTPWEERYRKVACSYNTTYGELEECKKMRAACQAEILDWRAIASRVTH